MIPGFDRALVGMTVGETRNIHLTAQEAYGPRIPDAVQTVPKTAFPDDFEYLVGEVIQGNGPQGPFLAKIQEERDTEVLLDFNHPLAGEDLNFEKTQNKDHDIVENNRELDNKFEEIEILVPSYGFDQNREEDDFELLGFESLPESVYMIVDKKVELELQPISGLPEWSFLPESELQRNAILLFNNQRSAKRLCSRNQRVIKIPNTRIFKLSKSYLIAKGITRLILEDSIIGLDN